MPKSRPPYPPEFRQRIIELVRRGRTPESLAEQFEQFEPSAQTIRNWLAQADRDAGQRPDGLTTDEREELPRLRQNKTVHETGATPPSRPMPGTLEALVAFVAEHQRCGDLDGGRDDGYVWLQCSCGGLIMHPASEPPKTRAAT